MEGQASVTLESSEDFKVGDKTLARFTDWKVVPTSDGKVRVVGKGKFGSPATAKPGNGFLRINGLSLSRRPEDLQPGRLARRRQRRRAAGLPLLRRPARDAVELAARGAQGAGRRRARLRGSRRRDTSWYDIYDDTGDQVYGGLDYGSGEDPGSTAAVKATAGEVLKSSGSVISAYFSSSNGGRTAASVDTWGGSLPYLISRQDPFDLNGSNPNRNWTVVLSPRALQNRLGAAKTPADAIVTSRKSGRVDRVRLERGSWARPSRRRASARNGSAVCSAFARAASTSASSTRRRRRRRPSAAPASGSTSWRGRHRASRSSAGEAVRRPGPTCP